ncbi:ATP-binding cassette domain-containing protein [Thiomicrorhabdus lithotrophica]|uniref:ATP-binding cassette domain-containing protein n=1 Tax=Thiomicrorhabdus lithotrophica TaxID=2949997 RepID=A0ABY8C8N7_9GAMM|nr:ATP-binding cassette domain-containing protein [Thiomicrorhabdus lithotrophica]WEJ62284.1 ATP-binding cassette domain-containing protein [Thiomicrorhabdus lithotrophica]
MLQISEILCQNVNYKVQSKLLLEEINSTFNSGEISVILGKNGAGKSTWLSLLSKELTPSSGQIFLQDTELDSCSFAELAMQRAVLPQLQNMVFSLKVQQLVKLGAEVQQQPSNANLITQATMQVCDIEHLAERDVVTLSGGEQKRVQLARVLAQIWPLEPLQANQTKPFSGKWLFLDEWTSSLDLHHQQLLSSCFKRWAQQGLGVVMVLHDLNLTSQLADKVKILKAGKLVSEGSTEEVLTPENILHTLDLKTLAVDIYGIKQPMILPVLEYE